MSNSLENRYIRQTTLTEVGSSGQQKILNTKVLVIGCGGLGSEVAVHLAASGIGHIHLVDFDKIDLSNLHRQVFYKETDISKFKAEVLSDYISSINSELNISFTVDKLIKSNIRALISGYDYILDCTDDLQTKYLVNDACVLEGKILVYASLHKFEGHVAVFNSKDAEGNRSTNLRDIYPEIPTENIPSCSEVGSLNSIVSIIANMQVNEVLKLVLGIGKSLINKMLVYQALDNSQLILKLKVNNDLDIVSNWLKTDYVDNVGDICSSLSIGLAEFRLLLVKEKIKIISVLEDSSSLDFQVDFHLPFSSFDLDDINLAKEEYIVVCKKGIRSLKAVRLLKEKYPDYSIKSLEGGLDSLVIT